MQVFKYGMLNSTASKGDPMHFPLWLRKFSIDKSNMVHGWSTNLKCTLDIDRLYIKCNLSGKRFRHHFRQFNDEICLMCSKGQKHEYMLMCIGNNVEQIIISLYSSSSILLNLGLVILYFKSTKREGLQEGIVHSILFFTHGKKS